VTAEQIQMMKATGRRLWSLYVLFYPEDEPGLPTMFNFCHVMPYQCSKIFEKYGVYMLKI
jgi:hypothetical protein